MVASLAFGSAMVVDGLSGVTTDEISPKLLDNVLLQFMSLQYNIQVEVMRSKNIRQICLFQDKLSPIG